MQEPFQPSAGELAGLSGVRGAAPGVQSSQHGHCPLDDSGANPSVSHYCYLRGLPVLVRALYLRRTGPVLSLIFGALSRLSPEEALACIG